MIRRSLLRAVERSLLAALPKPLTAELKNVRRALNNAPLADAARILDRVWRVYPDHAATTAPLLGRMLALTGADHYAGLRASMHAAEFGPDPDIAALIALDFLALQRLEDAHQTLESALAHYCVEPNGLIAAACSAYIRHPDVEVCGWVGRDAKLGLSGELTQRSGVHALEICIEGSTAFKHLLPPDDHPGVRPFSLCPGYRIDKRLTVTCRGLILLGSGTRTPTDFALDGRIEDQRRRCVAGWARIGWSPARPLRLALEDENGSRHEFKTRSTPHVCWQWPFELDLERTPLRGQRISVSARLPHGRWHELPDSPLLLKTAVRRSGVVAPRVSVWKTRLDVSKSAATAVTPVPIVDVIIPVYGHASESLACIDSVLATLEPYAHVVVIDDASNDDTLAQSLDTLAADGRITLLRNRENLGFVASANLGMNLHPDNDAILLNSDTRVFGDWLSRLRAAAYCASHVGTVTPFSNNGTIASYPNTAGGRLDVSSAAALHALAATTLAETRIEIPVGVGFCLYIRRDCLQDVGELDARLFAKGYGEETDFCLRARARGWSNQLAADVFVYHAAGISFGSRRRALLARSQRLINLRHPGYDAFIESFLDQDPLRWARRALDERRLRAFAGPFVLIMTLAHSGGVDRFVAERCRMLRAQGVFPLVIKPAAVGDVEHCVLSTDALYVPNLIYHIPADLSHLSGLLRGLPLDHIEIQHFLHLDARLVEAVRALNVPHDVFIHDYAWICPRITLIDDTGRYCGEPALAGCQACLKRNGSELGERISVPELRLRSTRWLKSARRVIAPSADAATRLQRYVADLQIDIQPHSQHLQPIRWPAPPDARTRVRVVLLGAIGEHKGFRVLLDCARDARARRLPLEFVVIGHTENDPQLLATGKVFITGYYDETEAAHLLQREQPDVAWLPSVWPETWSYTLDYILSTSLPVVAFDIGAIAERLRAAGHATLLPLQMGAALINDCLIEHLKRDRPEHFAENSGKSLMSDACDDVSMSIERGREMLMNDPSGKKPNQDAKEDGLSASVQVLPLPSGLYLFSVKASGPPIPSGVGKLSLPALHVGLGPGVRPDQVEFLGGPSTHGAWLFSAGDLLVAKIIGIGATLVLTSVRAPAGEVLSIKVERLEDREDAPAQPSQAAKTSAVGVEAVSGNGPDTPVFDDAGDLPLPVQIGVHIRTRGDVKFTNVPWAGRLGTGLWLESFSVRPLERFGAQDIEYKGLTGSGFETPWISDDKMCGTRGMATPLVGFALRLKPSSIAAAFDCEYSGYFQSGTTVGPLRNGAPCRSSVANDTLEGIQVRIVRRAATVLPEATVKSSAASAEMAEVDRTSGRRQPSHRT